MDEPVVYRYASSPGEGVIGGMALFGGTTAVAVLLLLGPAMVGWPAVVWSCAAIVGLTALIVYSCSVPSMVRYVVSNAAITRNGLVRSKTVAWARLAEAESYGRSRIVLRQKDGVFITVPVGRLQSGEELRERIAILAGNVAIRAVTAPRDPLSLTLKQHLLFIVVAGTASLVFGALGDWKAMIFAVGAGASGYLSHQLELAVLRALGRKGNSWLDAIFLLIPPQQLMMHLHHTYKPGNMPAMHFASAFCGLALGLALFAPPMWKMIRERLDGSSDAGSRTAQGG